MKTEYKKIYLKTILKNVNRKTEQLWLGLLVFSYVTMLQEMSISDKQTCFEQQNIHMKVTNPWALSQKSVIHRQYILQPYRRKWDQ